MRRSLRTRSRKRKTIKTPGGRRKLQFRKEKPGWRKCRFCGGRIHGISVSPKSAHSEKTVERLYGGEVCPACLEKSFIAVAASEWKV
ncbi:MAG: hypothetical protein RMI43_05590 [Candidatus Caldarchaeum sp.]|nr:60S ribosomal protein L34 [Candidatus Caldarchaeum sp.]MDW8063623.1 hypothetical protein [Candidatus Caldarchaeum sp.]